jgi:hypothetical protein
MKLRDPFIRLSRHPAWRFRLRLSRSPGGSSARRAVPPSARARERERRGLALLDRALTADEPRLAGLYRVFNQLTAAEEPVTSERLPVPHRPRPRPVHAALLASLALVAVVCLALSTQLHSSTGQCTAGSAGGTVATSIAYAQEHGKTCPAYPSQQQP